VGYRVRQKKPTGSHDKNCLFPRLDKHHHQILISLIKYNNAIGFFVHWLFPILCQKNADYLFCFQNAICQQISETKQFVGEFWTKIDLVLYRLTKNNRPYYYPVIVKLYKKSTPMNLSLWFVSQIK